MRDKIHLEYLAESMYQNFLKESTTTGDMAQWASLIIPLVKKIYPQSLVSQIASVQATNSPVAQVSALVTSYSGSATDITLTNSKIITVASSAVSALAVSGTVINTSGVSGANNFNVFYSEDANQYTVVYGQAGPFSGAPVLARGFNDTYAHMLVRINSGNVNTGDTFSFTSPSGTASTQILYASGNRNVIKRIFANYAGILEKNTDMREVKFSVIRSLMNTNTRKINSNFSQEFMTDLEKVYGNKTPELMATYISNEITQEIDREIISYLKNIATPMGTDIDLTQSVAKTGSDLAGITYDLYAGIFFAIEEIVRATKRNRTMFVLADSTTAGYLTLNALHSSAEPEKSNPYHVGSIGPYPLFCDPYSTEHYILVGYRFESDALDDAGLIYSPYTTTMVETTDPNTFQKRFASINRYGYMRHPQDTGTGNGDSDFFRYMAVNYYDNYSPIPNLQQLAKTYY